MAKLKDILIAQARVPGTFLAGTPLAAIGTSVSGMMDSAAKAIPAMPAGIPEPELPAPPTLPVPGAPALGGMFGRVKVTPLGDGAPAVYGVTPAATPSGIVPLVFE